MTVATITATALDELVTTLAKSKLPGALSGSIIRQIHANHESIVGLSRDTVAGFVKLAAGGDVSTAEELLFCAIRSRSIIERAHARTERENARDSLSSIWAKVVSMRSKIFKGVVAALLALATEAVMPLVLEWLEGIGGGE